MHMKQAGAQSPPPAGRLARCPIYEATRRGLGAALLRKPAKLARLVEGIAAASPIPLTGASAHRAPLPTKLHPHHLPSLPPSAVKIRVGQSADKINVHEVVPALAAAGAALVTVHGRTSVARYSGPADWGLIGEVATYHVPVIGNGDILTHYEAERRLQAGGVHAVMVGRGALIKPWIFQEFREGRTLSPTAAERVGIYRQLVAYMKEHFGDDARGKRSAFYFFPW